MADLEQDPPHAPEFESYDDELFSGLTPVEERWRDRQQFLQSMGYMLRPRYRPGWVPSWRGTGGLIQPTKAEDGIPLPLRDHLIDATRISDGKLVYIKRVKTGDKESRIAIMLSSPDLRTDPRNHSVPIIHTFQDDEDSSISYIVMPFLMLFDRLPFKHVDEVTDLVDQFLEGLVFLHEHGVAHRDCTNKNLMMDASALFPKGFHPIYTVFLPDAKTSATILPRSSAKLTYYYIDYGISQHFPPGKPRGLVVGKHGRDREVPELSLTVPYDPFKVDIFIIGNVLRHTFHDKYANVEFLIPLINAMTQTDPARRPDAEEALRLWQRERKRIGSFFGRWPLKKRSDVFLINLINDASGLYDVLSSFVKGIFQWVAGP